MEDLHIRKVIGGRVYDTETAQFVHVVCANGGHIALDFHAEYTALYRTRRGAYFVAGQSGACGRWKHFRHGSHCPGQGIEVIGKQKLAGCSSRRTVRSKRFST